MAELAVAPDSGSFSIVAGNGGDESAYVWLPAAEVPHPALQHLTDCHMNGRVVRCAAVSNGQSAI